LLEKKNIKIFILQKNKKKKKKEKAHKQIYYVNFSLIYMNFLWFISIEFYFLFVEKI